MYRSPRTLIVLFVLLSMFAVRSSNAQSSDRSPVDTVRNLSDSAIDAEAFHMTKSPTTAALLSAALPGAGQVYLDQAWKVPIIAGLAGGFLYGALIQNSRYLDQSNQYYALIDKHTAVDSFQAQIHAGQREFYRDDRDKWWIYLGLTYIANILDAYIAANLYDFDVSDPTPAHFDSYYDPTNRSWRARFELRF